MKKDLLADIDQTILLLKKEIEKPQSSRYLPDIIAGLEEIQDSLLRGNVPPQKRVGMANALGRIVADDDNLADSDIGKRVFGIGDQLAGLSHKA